MVDISVLETTLLKIEWKMTNVYLENLSREVGVVRTI